MSRMLRVGLVLLAAASLLRGSPADAQAVPASLGGYQGSAAASALHVFYNPVGLLPLGAPVDLGVPDALATIAPGPSTFARSSVADPGDLLANPDALIQQAAGPTYEPGTIPAYPYRVSASSGVGAPTSEVTPAPGLRAHVSADATGSVAEGTLPIAEAPGLVRIGSASSTASTTTDGSTVTVHAVSSIGRIDLLGLVTIDGVVTDLTATSDGTTTTATGGTEVLGARVLGRPVTIDGSGIHGLEAITDPLAALGLTVTVAGAVPQGDGATAGQLSAAGLRIDLEVSEATLPVLGAVLDALPPLPPLAPGLPSGDDVVAVLRARHLVSIHLAGAAVSVSARPVTPAVTPPTTAPTANRPTGITPSAPVVTGSRPSAVTPTTGPAVALDPVAPTAVDGAAATSAGLAEGIGAIAFFALLVLPFVGRGLADGALLLTGAPGPTDHCPREGT